MKENAAISNITRMCDWFWDCMCERANNYVFAVDLAKVDAHK